MRGYVEMAGAAKAKAKAGAARRECVRGMDVLRERLSVRFEDD